MEFNRPDTGIPFDATYDPDAAYAFEQAGGQRPLPPLEQPSLPAPAMANVGIDEATGTMQVNGKQFNINDHKSALETEGLLGDDKAPVPIPQNFRPLSATEYHNYLNQIDDPSLGRMLKKNFGIGVDNLQLLGGRGLQFLGADELGTAIVDQQIEDLSYNEPYQKAFTDIKSAGDAGMWFAANLAQQGPNLIESALAALAGAAIGGVSGGPLGAVIGGFGGFMMKFGGKEGLKKAAISAGQKKLKGEALDETEEGLLHGLAASTLAQTVKGQKQLGGAALGSLASNYGMGVADIYGEQVEAGTEDRATVLGLASLYAAAESIPEFFGLGYLTRGAKTGWRGNKLRRGAGVAAATGVGALGEGVTEAAQEGLLISQNPDLTDDEIRLRFINSFAAGAGVGGTLAGGASALRRGRKAIDPSDANTPTSIIPETERPTLGTEVGSQGEMFPDLIGSYESDGQPNQAELLAERDSLLEERGRMLRAEGGIYADVDELMNRETELSTTTVEDMLQRLRGQQDNYAEQDKQLDDIVSPALTEIDRLLSDPRFEGLPPRALASAQRLGSQPTLFDPQSTPIQTPDQRSFILRGGEGTAPVLTPAAQGDMFNGAELGQDPSVLGDGQTPDLFGGTQGSAIRNLQTFDAQQAAAMQERIQPFENTQSNRIEGVQQPLERNMSVLENELAAPTPLAPTQMEMQFPNTNPYDLRQEQQFQEAERGIQGEFDLRGGQANQSPGADFPAFNAPYNTTLFPFAATAEPTINMPVRVSDTEVVMQPVPVRQALEDSRQRIESLEEGQPTDRFDAAKYATKRKDSTRRAFLEMRLRDAKRERAAIISEAQRLYPNEINSNGEFFEDLLAAQYEAEEAGQLSAFVPDQGRASRSEERTGPFNERSMASDPEKTTAEVRADLARQSVADPREVEADDNAKAKTKKKAGGTKRSPAKVAKPKQPASPSKTAKGAAALKRGNKGTAKTGTEKKSPDENQSTEQPQPEQPQRQDEQPTDIKYPTAKAAWDGLREQALANPNREYNFILSWQEIINASSSPEAKTAKAKWETAFKNGKADIATLEAIYENVSDMKSAVIGSAIDYITTAASREDFILGARMLFESTVILPEGETQQSTKAWFKRAMPYVDGSLDGLYDTLDHIAFSKEAFILAAADVLKPKTRTLKNGDLDIVPPKYSHNNKEKPWVTVALDQGWILETVNALDVTPTNPTQELTDMFAATGIDAEVASIVKDTQRRSEVAELADEATTSLMTMLDKALSLGQLESAAIKFYTSAFKSTVQQGANLTESYRGAPLKDWVSRDQDDLFVGGRLNPPTGAQNSTEQVLTDMDAKPNDGRASLLETGKPITRPLSMDRVKRFLQRARRSIKNGPRILAYTNLEQFRTRNPEAYKEAMTSRQDRKGIPDNAAGYSFGRTVVIFQENIKSKHHLAFVVGHEVIGHFGLASVMPKPRLKKLMDDIYTSDPYVRAEADRRIETLGMDKTEAVEEAVADLAGEADASTIIRVWNAIKTFLNKLGLEFSDDMARYFVNQSRRMVRTGTTGDTSASGIYADLIDIQKRFVDGRASANLAGASGFMRSNMGADGITSAWGLAQQAMGNFTSMAGTDQNVRAAASKMGDVSTSIGRGLELLQSLDNKGLRSLGLQRVFQLFERQTAHVRQLQSILSDKTSFSNRFELLGRFSEVVDNDDWKNGPAPKAEERQQANELLEQASMYRREMTSEKLIGEQSDLLTVEGGFVKRNKTVIEDVIAKGTVTRAQFEAGLKLPKVDDQGQVIKGEYEILKPSVPITGRVWKIYEEQRAAINEAAIMVYEDKVKGMIGAKQAELEYLQTNYDLPQESVDVMSELVDTYSKMYVKGANLQGQGFTWNSAEIERAKAFIHHTMRVMDKDNGDAKLKDWENGPKKNADGTLAYEGDASMVQFLGDPKLLAKLRVLNATKIQNAQSVRNTLMRTQLLETQLTNAQFGAIRSMLSAYVPFVRRGNFQVRVEAYDKNGERLRLDESVSSMLFYTRTNSRSDAKAQAERLNKEFETFSDTTVSLMTYKNAKDADGTPIRDTKSGVTFRAVFETARTVPPLGQSINYDAVANTLVQAGIQLSEADVTKLVQMTTKQHSMARSRLQRSGNPGWDRNIMHGVAEHLEMQAHIAGKNRYRHSLARIIDDKTVEPNLWRGNKKKLETLQAKFLATLNSSDAQQISAYKALGEYQHMYMHSSSEPSIKVYDRKGTETTVAGLGKSNQYESDAAALLSYYDNTTNIVDNTGETIIGRAAGPLMSMTAVMQLGGTLAPALVNMVSLVSHAMPYLSTLNKKTGYGGGFGPGAASAAIFRASRDLSLLSEGIFKDVVGDAALIKEEILDPPWTKGETRYGMTKDEAIFLHALTEKGVLTPNMFNALMGTARTGKQDKFMPRATEKWMILFSKTEQFNRRVTAMAAYRLDKNRRIENGDATAESFSDPRSKAAKEVYASAVRAVDASQGNYSQFNRPSWARGNVMQYVYMYKQFVVITVQLMKNLGRREQLMMLAFLVLVSGLKGVPFGEDLMDLIDTLMQKFGIPWEGVEANIAQMADAIIPGSSRLLLRGVLDYAFGATVSTRLGMGNLIPGTSMFLAGANTAREATDIIGPVASAITGVASAIALTTQYVAETVGIRDDTLRLRDIARTGFGFSGGKALAEGLIFYSDGSVSNKKGQVVATDFGLVNMVTRILGFYPQSATTQYDIESMTRRVDEYGKVLKAGYVKAYREADTPAERSSVRRAVKDFNSGVGRKSPFYIRNFTQSAVKSKREAERTATARSLKSAPTSSKAFRKELMSAQGIDSRGISIGE